MGTSTDTFVGSLKCILPRRPRAWLYVGLALAFFSASHSTIRAQGVGSIDVPVATGNDDAEEDTTGAVSRNSTDLELVLDNDDQVVGIRFVGVAIPPGSNILNAHVQFQVDAANSNATSLLIQGQAADNPPTFATTAFGISSRPRTTAAVSWAPQAWPTVGEAGAAQRTADLATVIQEIVDRPAWASGNALALIITGTGKRVAESFNGLAAAAPLLHVEFEPFAPNSPPDVAINEPVNGGSFEQGAPVSFAGAATDTEDGNLSASLAWTSDRNGQIGSGPTFTRSDLSAGAHTIAAQAADSDGATDSATVQIAITIGGNAPPAVTIATPPPASSSFKGQFVSFTGTANDLEDGSIAASLTWSSNLDGPIGTGGEFTTRDLSVGTHTITASVTDGGGLTSQAQVTVTVDVSAPAILVGAGNIADCTDVEDEATATLLDGTPGIVFTLGDNAYEDANAADFANCYAPTWGRHKARTLPAIGKQEYKVPVASAYFDYFGTAAGDRTKGYYSYDAGEWHVVVLNSECSQVGGCGRYSPQGQWLQADLAAHPSTCVLAMWNQPLFSSTSGASANTRDFWQILYEAGADLVLNAHRNSFERFAPQDPDGAAKPTQGIREFVVGTGGTGVNAYSTVAPNSEVRNGDTFGIMKLTLRPTSYDWQFLPIAGQSFTDSGSASCVGAQGNHSPAVTITAPFNGSGFAPATSIVFSATAIDPEFGDVSASLTWTSSLDGAIGSGPTFSASTLSPGTHAITATATDGLLSSSDVTTITVFTPGTVEVRIAASNDDAEEAATGDVSRTSSDLELVFDVDDQQVGMRFLGVAIPPAATITKAYLQFQVDQAVSIPTALIVEGEAADNPATFAATSFNISSRPRTTAAVSWAPPPWPTVGQAGPDQQTPDLAPVIQEIVGRPGWASGNAMVLMVRGTGKRVAESYNGLPAGAPLLHVEYTTGGGGPENQAPGVSAGPDQTIPACTPANLSGTVIDDGLPQPPGAIAVSWSHVGGSGLVTFSNPASITTSASFSGPGSYVLRLTGDDGALTGVDDLTVTVQGAPNQPPSVAAGSDQIINVNDGAVLTATATDDGYPCGSALTYAWSLITAPPGGWAGLTTSNLSSTRATFSAPGTYLFRVTTSDGELSASDEIAVTVRPGRDALLVLAPWVSDSNERGRRQADEDAATVLLERLDFAVTPVLAAALRPADVLGRDVIVVLPGVEAAPALGSATSPVVVMSPSLLDDLGMTDSLPTPSPQGPIEPFGTQPNVADIRISNPTHPLAAGLSSATFYTVYRWYGDMLWGRPPASAVTVARISYDDGYPTRYTVFGYDTGSTLANGAVTSARRVAYFGRPSLLNTRGESLFDAAITWAAASAYRPSVLLVAGSTTLNAAETALKQRIEGLGFDVPVVTSIDAGAQAVGKEAVVLADTSSGAGLSALRTLAVPLITWNTAQYSPLGLTGPVAGTDFGSSTALTSLDILSPLHPLAAGLTGQPQVFSSAAPLSWGVPGAGAAAVASLPGGPTRATVFGYEVGAAMVGLSAPDRRAGFFLSAGAAASVTARGGGLFDAALLWVAASDADGDGLDRRTELRLGTDPSNADTNHDGIRDGDAVRLGLSPTNLDMDGDGLTNLAETIAGTDPFSADTDGDGVADSGDAFPLDPTQSQSGPSDINPPNITLIEPADAVLVSTNP